MTVYNFYLFDRAGTLLYYAEWTRNKQSGMARDQEGKLMYGMIYSIRSFVNKVAVNDLRDGFITFATNKYRLSILETPTRLRMVLNTDVSATGTRELLHQIYTQGYVECVVYNPLCVLGQPIESELFATRVDEIVRQSPIFSSKLT